MTKKIKTQKTRLEVVTGEKLFRIVAAMLILVGFNQEISAEANTDLHALTLKHNKQYFTGNTENEKTEATTTHVYDLATTTIDTAANETTKKLYAYLLSQFGKRIISGQTDGYYDAIVSTTSGINPLYRTWDFQHYTQGYSYLWSNGANNGAGGFSFGVDSSQKVAEKAIAWYNSTEKKGIVGFHWHWHSPSAGTVGTNTFYSANTSFSARQAVVTTTSQFTQIIQDIDAIAVQLKKLNAADVPVLWRPLHEASGNGATNGSGAWFWWGASGNTVCKKLYDIVYDRLVNYHGLHNLIWVWSSPEATWYPGNSKVDILGYDSYPGNYNYTVQKTLFDQLYTVTGGNKLLAMTENGPIPDIQNCFSSDTPWSLFMSWNDLVFAQNSTQHILDVYNNPLVITLENVNATVTSLNMPENKEEALVTVYPNPASDKLLIAIKAEIAATISKIELSNLQGEIIISNEGYKNSLSLESLPSGVYVLNIYFPNYVLRYKIIR